jgi:carboxyl-terminal processing protease
MTGTAYAQAGSQPPACVPPTSPAPPSVKPTTITTIGQAYYCIFANYYSGPVLDDRVLLAGAFAGFANELEHLGLDQPHATLPTLTGDRDTDWAAFSAVYQKVTGGLRASAAVLQEIAAATMTGMLAALHDNHAEWTHRDPAAIPPGYKPGKGWGIGISTVPTAGLASGAPQETVPPLYISSVVGGPAARAGLRPGDVIESVNGAPPFTDGVISPGVIDLLFQQYPQQQPLRLTLYRPATGRTWTITLRPAVYTLSAAATAVVTSRLLDGNVGYVRMTAFAPGSANQVLKAIASLRKGRTLRGIILDLRDNGGGAPEVATLLGAFEHGRAFSYDCDVNGSCTANYPDASTPLLHLPLVLLTSRDCASACDAFSGAVKDLHLGTLVGTRTWGAASGPGTDHFLDDGSELGLPAKHELSADHEIIDGIGVAPDYYLPMTAWDLSTGHDPDIAKALTLLES